MVAEVWNRSLSNCHQLSIFPAHAHAWGPRYGLARARSSRLLLPSAAQNERPRTRGQEPRHRPRSADAWLNAVPGLKCTCSTCSLKLLRTSMKGKLLRILPSLICRTVPWSSHERMLPLLPFPLCCRCCPSGAGCRCDFFPQTKFCGQMTLCPRRQSEEGTVSGGLLDRGRGTSSV